MISFDYGQHYISTDFPRIADSVGSAKYFEFEISIDVFMLSTFNRNAGPHGLRAVLNLQHILHIQSI